MDNVGIVVEDLDAAIEFFTELGLTLEGRMLIEGESAGRVTGVRGQRVEIAMMRRTAQQQLGEQSFRENPVERERR
jgi:catechol 2,3-dioxygenase-like lactoylglutathione lyase family enzyme